MLHRARLALVHQFLSIVLMIGFAVASARWLGPEGKGELTLVTTSGVLLGSIVALGIPQSLTAWVSGRRLDSRTAVMLGTAWSVLLAGALGLGAWVLGAHRIEAQFLWVSAGVYVWEQAVSGVSVGNGDLVPQVVLRFVGGGALVAVMMAAWLLEVPRDVSVAVPVYYVLVASGVAAGVIALWVRTRSATRMARAAWREELVPLASFGMKAVPGQLLNMANYRLDFLLLGWLAGPRALGVYSLAVSATLLVGVVPAAIGQALTSSFGAEGGEVLSLALGVKCAIVSGAVAGFIIAVLSPALIPVVFGKEFGPATALILVMVPFTAMFSTVQVSLPFFYNRLRKPLLHSLVIGSTVLLDVLLVVVLVPPMGAMGAAIASAAAYGTGALVNLALAARGAGLTLRQLAVPTVADMRWMLGRTRSLLAVGR